MAPSLSDIMDEAGVPATMQTYIKAREIFSVAVFARMGIEEKDVMESLVEPFIAGVEIDGTAHRCGSDVHVLRASVLAAWDHANIIRTKAAAEAAASGLGGPPWRLSPCHGRAWPIPRRPEFRKCWGRPEPLETRGWRSQVEIYEKMT